MVKRTVVRFFSRADLMKAVGAKKLGTYPALAGWTLHGFPVESVTFQRNKYVSLTMLGVAVEPLCFNGAPLDD